eukprot:TRINITY_DN178_c0_g2_i3.p4 TRINITY_DN178_c0_g2~~TRINITY_DN178_c0_g2_i3.p4  ORF type:complete len:141 (+),score=17.98 TRINITY_DN178_c0_g2_i3:649-1071(+)
MSRIPRRLTPRLARRRFPKDAPAVEALLHGGTAVEAVSGNGDMALHCATIGGQVAVMYALLTAGANAEAECSSDEMTDASKAQQSAAHGGSAEAAPALLAAGAAVHVRNNDGMTALHLSGACGNAELVKTLLAAGADVHF